MEGSLAAVSIPIYAGKDSLCSIYWVLHQLHIFTPLQIHCSAGIDNDFAKKKERQILLKFCRLWLTYERRLQTTGQHLFLKRNIANGWQVSSICCSFEFLVFCFWMLTQHLDFLNIRDCLTMWHVVFVKVTESATLS